VEVFCIYNREIFIFEEHILRALVQHIYKNSIQIFSYFHTSIQAYLQILSRF